MSWISGNCQDDRNFSCYYQTFGSWVCDDEGYCTYEVESWCVDSNDQCPGSNDGGALVKAQDNRKSSGGW